MGASRKTPSDSLLDSPRYLTMSPPPNGPRSFRALAPDAGLPLTGSAPKSPSPDSRSSSLEVSDIVFLLSLASLASFFLLEPVVFLFFFTPPEEGEGFRLFSLDFLPPVFSSEAWASFSSLS